MISTSFHHRRDRPAWKYRRPTAVKLHGCSTKWKVGPCWRVQKALDEQGIDYEVVKGPACPGKRADLQRLSGQKLYPVIAFENGSIYREESKDMATTIQTQLPSSERQARSREGRRYRPPAAAPRREPRTSLRTLRASAVAPKRLRNRGDAEDEQYDPQQSQPRREQKSGGGDCEKGG